MMPFFSICIATKNVESLIPMCLESLTNQNFTDFEVVIQDSLSTDSTLETVARVADPRISVVSEKDCSIADAWNRAVRRAKGKWIIFLGADDALYDDNTLGKLQLDLINPVSQVFIGKVAYADKSGRKLYEDSPSWNRTRFKRGGMSFCHQGVVHSREIFNDFSFNPQLRFAADFDFLIRCFEKLSPVVLHWPVALVGVEGLTHQDDLSIKVFKEYRSIQIAHNIRPNSLIIWKIFKAHIKLFALRILGRKIGRKFNNFFKQNR